MTRSGSLNCTEGFELMPGLQGELDRRSVDRFGCEDCDNRASNEEMNEMNRFLRLAAAFVGEMLEQTVRSTRTAAVPDESHCVDSKFACSLDIGVLNYRTGRLDNGTDAYGWYEHD